MKIQSKIIKKFFDDLPDKCKSPLDKIITQMLDSSKYIDGSTLIYDENNELGYDKEHYHNWDCNPIEINEVKNIKNYEYNEDNDIELTKILGKYSSPNIECIKGDIQLGKRVHACIIMWMSIYIYERPVLYLFRPLNIDKEQLQDDIDGEEPWNFNIEWIKNKFNNCKENEFNNKKYYDYKLPSLTDIKDKKVANKLSDKEYLSKPKMIYMALMNPTDLETLNRKFYEYIIKYREKVNITLIIDESDLLSPTAENSNNISKDDTKNSKSERLISRLVNKIVHTMNITGTAHTFFWNYTTTLNEEEKTFIPIKKIFIMTRHDNYYGFMKKNINFSTYKENLPTINEWWSEEKYSIDKDYIKNIKSIIDTITKRKNTYNSFLISEEKIQDKQIGFAEKIIKDFHSLFCVIFHGKKGKNGLPTGLRLYFPKKIDNLDIELELQQVVISEKRLDKVGGLKGTPTSVTDNNFYKYYDIDMKSKDFNIKKIYKVLAMLFKKIKSNKTVITITGKYGERGYSFTSDYYDNDNKYVLHLTDQYFVSHASYNCTDIFQRGRIQGRYTDNPNLIFWTTDELVKIINEYVNFIAKIENKIMSLPRGHKYIRNLCELNLVHPEFIKALGRPKQRKNLESKCIKYDKKNNAMIYSFPPHMDPEKYEECFLNWLKDQNIDFNGFINKLEKTNRKNYLEKHGVPDYDIKTYFDLSKEKLDVLLKKEYKNRKIDNDGKFMSSVADFKSKVWDYTELYKIIKSYSSNSFHGLAVRKDKFPPKLQRTWVGYENNATKYILKTATQNGKKILKQSSLDIFQESNYIEVENNIIQYSKLNYKYINDTFLEHEFDKDLGEDDGFDLLEEDIKTLNENSYFFLSADGYVYHHDPEKSIKKVKIQIKSEIEETISSKLINPILTFSESCIKETKGSKRVCAKKLMEDYNTWCKNEKNGGEYKKLKDFRINFEKITGLKRSKTNKFGYKIELKI